MTPHGFPSHDSHDQRVHVDHEYDWIRDGWSLKWWLWRFTNQWCFEMGWTGSYSTQILCFFCLLKNDMSKSSIWAPKVHNLRVVSLCYPSFEHFPIYFIIPEAMCLFDTDSQFIRIISFASDPRCCPSIVNSLRCHQTLAKWLNG